MASHSVFAARWLLVLVACLAIQARAREAAPLVYPQWISAFPRDVFARDGIAAGGGPSWARLAGGDHVLVTVEGNTLILRRFAANGTVLAARQVSLFGDAGMAISTVVVRVDASGNGAYILAGTFGGACQLLRVGEDLQTRWSIRAPGSYPQQNGCVDLSVLADDSIAVIQDMTLARIAGTGETLWMIEGEDVGRSLWPHALAVDASGVIWVASRGQLQTGDNVASVMRFHADGTLLSSDDLRCFSCGALAMDIAADGTVSVGGGAGTAQSGFLARYRPDGTRRFAIKTAPDERYTRVDHDASGAVYALAVDGPTQRSLGLRRLDASTGAVLWTVPADDFVARSSGIVVTRRSNASIGVTATALDDGGHVLWNTPLSPTAAATVRIEAVEADALDILVQDASASDTCGASPRLMRLDGSGQGSELAHACTMPGAYFFGAIDALPGGGALANLETRLVAFSPEGSRRWEKDVCPACDPLELAAAQWIASALVPDGGGWAVRRVRPSPALPAYTATIERIDNEGHSISSTPLAAEVADTTEMRLLGTAADVIAAQTPFEHGVAWQKVSSDGTTLGSATYPIPDDFFHIDSARRLADDSATLVVRGDVPCGTGCSPGYVTVLRIAGDGALEWRYQFPGFSPSDVFVSLTDEGGALAVVIPYSIDGLLELRTVGADGTPAAPVPLAEIPAFSQPYGLAGPVDGHWLLWIAEWPGGSESVFCIDASGHVTASIRNALASPVAWSARGYLFSDLVGAFAMRDPVSLNTTAQFRIGSARYASAPWSVLDDGAVYGSIWQERDGISVPALARYSVPGSQPTNLIFRDGFD